MRLTGRIEGVPATVIQEEVLDPQFALEARTLLPGYAAIEKVLVLEYLRMGFIGRDEAHRLAGRLATLEPGSIAADAEANLSDIALAIERHVHDGGPPPSPAWHADRSRNDLQACAQLMYARDELLTIIGQLAGLAGTLAEVAGRGADLPMPGYTHLQAAQVMTPGFYLAAWAEETLRAVRQLRTTFDAINQCPLGAGAMAGQELDWDVRRMSDLLGFDRPVPHALVAVASRGWALRLSGDLSAYAVVVSRFVTDLMAWASGAYGFVDLPDELAGISAAMPQKRNFPVLERIRGRTAHLSALHLDLLMGQRATPYANMVEVSKEASTNLPVFFGTARSLLRLTTTVVGRLRFVPERMRAACDGDYLGGFRLANLLTLRAGIPWRQSQVLAGQYIAEVVRAGRPAGDPDGPLLKRLAVEAGVAVPDYPDRLLADAFDIEAGLAAKVTPGSTRPDRVRDLVAAQHEEAGRHLAWCRERQTAVSAALNALHRQLSGGDDAV